MSEWMDIETAPKDGREVLLGFWTDNYYDSEEDILCRKFERHVGFYNNREGWECTFYEAFLLHPTHWAQLPNPPEDTMSIHCGQCNHFRDVHKKWGECCAPVPVWVERDYPAVSKVVEHPLNFAPDCELYENAEDE